MAKLGWYDFKLILAFKKLYPLYLPYQLLIILTPGKWGIHSFSKLLEIVITTTNFVKSHAHLAVQTLTSSFYERLRNLSKLKNPAIFHKNNTKSFIERIPFFRHVRLTKSVKLKNQAFFHTVSTLRGKIPNVQKWSKPWKSSSNFALIIPTSPSLVFTEYSNTLTYSMILKISWAADHPNPLTPWPLNTPFLKHPILKTP